MHHLRTPFRRCFLLPLPLAAAAGDAAAWTADDDEEDAVVVDAIVGDVTERFEGVGVALSMWWCCGEHVSKSASVR